MPHTRWNFIGALPSAAPVRTRYDVGSPPAGPRRARSVSHGDVASAPVAALGRRASTTGIPSRRPCEAAPPTPDRIAGTLAARPTQQLAGGLVDGTPPAPDSPGWAPLAAVAAGLRWLGRSIAAAWLGLWAGVGQCKQALGPLIGSPGRAAASESEAHLAPQHSLLLTPPAITTPPAQRQPALGSAMPASMLPTRTATLISLLPPSPSSSILSSEAADDADEAASLFSGRSASSVTTPQHSDGPLGSSSNEDLPLLRPSLRLERAGSWPATVKLGAKPLWHTGTSLAAPAMRSPFVWVPKAADGAASRAEVYDVLRARLGGPAVTGTSPLFAADALASSLPVRRLPHRWKGPRGLTIASTPAFRALLRKTVQDEPGIAMGTAKMDDRLPLQFERDAFRDRPSIVLQDAATHERRECVVALPDGTGDDDVVKAAALRSAGDWLEELCRGDRALVRQVAYFLSQNTLNGVNFAFIMAPTVARRTSWLGERIPYHPLFQGEELRSLRARPAPSFREAMPVIEVDIQRAISDEMSFRTMPTADTLVLTGRYTQRLRIELLRDGDRIVQRNLRLDLFGQLDGKRLKVALYP